LLGIGRYPDFVAGYLVFRAFTPLPDARCLASPVLVDRYRFESLLN
jgi:hypothetical protein